jgi:hypothetical protein
MSAIEFKKQVKRQFNLVEKNVEYQGKTTRVYVYDETTVD